MKIDLNHFEQIIDPTILKRGLQYFKQGKVSEVEESYNEITAMVDGSGELYTTTIKTEGDIVIETDCSCPYDMGPVCKHVVALIFHIKQEELGIEVKIKSEIKPKTKSKSERELEQIEQLIESSTKEQLGEFVNKLCMQDRATRLDFLAQFQPKDSAISKSEYKSSLSAYANSLKQHGFIDYRSARNLGNAFYEMCAVAEQKIENKDYISAINAACAVLEQATKALLHTDDSSGCIGDSIDLAAEILNRIANHTIDDQSRNYLLKYIFKSYEKGVFEGWNWHEGMLKIALHLVQSDAEKTKLRTLIQALIDKGDDNWRADDNKELMAKFLEITEGEEVMLNYMQVNIEVEKFRSVFIESAIKIGDYKEAIRLVNEVCNDYEDRRQENWLRYLLDIYTLMGDKKSVIKFSRAILLLTCNNVKSCYTILKSNVPKDEWNIFRSALYIDIKKTWWDNDKLIRLAVWEEDWDMYLNNLRKSLNYDLISNAVNHLPNEYHSLLSQIYRDAILKNMENNVGRTHYQNAARAIRRIMKLGERQIANELVDELRNKYKMRPALIEELSKV